MEVVAPILAKPLGADSTIVLSENRVSKGFSRKKDPWKEWKWKVPLESQVVEPRPKLA